MTHLFLILVASLCMAVSWAVFYVRPKAGNLAVAIFGTSCTAAIIALAAIRFAQ